MRISNWANAGRPPSKRRNAAVRIPDILLKAGAPPNQLWVDSRDPVSVEGKISEFPRKKHTLPRNHTAHGDVRETPSAFTPWRTHSCVQRSHSCEREMLCAEHVRQFEGESP